MSTSLRTPRLCRCDLVGVLLLMVGIGSRAMVVALYNNGDDCVRSIAVSLVCLVGT